MPYFNSDWHDVPEGTSVNILGRFTRDADGLKIVQVERVDGVPLPGPVSPAPSALVAAQFINEQ